MKKYILANNNMFENEGLYDYYIFWRRGKEVCIHGTSDPKSVKDICHWGDLLKKQFHILSIDVARKTWQSFIRNDTFRRIL